MSTCIIHIGMHKTGTSSIQKTFHSIRSSGSFVYADMGGIPKVFDGGNHSHQICMLFSSSPAEYDLCRKLGWDNRKGEITKLIAEFRGNLERCILSSPGKTMIISGEGIPALDKEDLFKMKEFLGRYYDEILVVGYVRSPKSFMESSFQQKVRVELRHKSFSDLCSGSYPGYKRRFEKFYEVFSAGAVRLWKFDPSVFPGGCVVRDFSARLGIEIPTEKIIRNNMSISKEAVSLLYFYKKHVSGFGRGANAIRAQRQFVNRALTGIGEDKVCLSTELVSSILKKNRADIEWMEEKLGESLTEEIRSEKDGCITCEEDLLKISGSVMAQLSAMLYEGAMPKRPSMKTRKSGKAGRESRAVINEDGRTDKPETEKEKVMLNRSELMGKLMVRISQKSDKPGVRKSARLVMDEFIQLLIDELKTSGEVRIPKLGALRVVEKPADAEKPARKVIKFAMSKDLKEYFQQG